MKKIELLFCVFVFVSTASLFYSDYRHDIDRDGIKRLEIVVDCVTAAIFITSPKWAPSLLLLPPPTVRGNNHSSVKLKDPQSNWHVQ